MYKPAPKISDQRCAEILKEMIDLMGITDPLSAVRAHVTILESAGPLDFYVWKARQADDVLAIRDRLRKSAEALKTAYQELSRIKIYSPEDFDTAAAFGLDMDAIARSYAITSTIADSKKSRGVGKRSNDELKKRTADECSAIWEKYTERPLPKTTDGKGSKFCRLYYEIAAGEEAPLNSFQKPRPRERVKKTAQ